MYAYLACCLVQAEVGCESFGVSGGEGGVWTACARVSGVQIWDVDRNGRHVRVGVASRLGM